MGCNKLSVTVGALRLVSRRTDQSMESSYIVAAAYREQLPWSTDWELLPFGTFALSSLDV